jgi:hypothetical protein
MIGIPPQDWEAAFERWSSEVIDAITDDFYKSQFRMEEPPDGQGDYFYRLCRSRFAILETAMKSLLAKARAAGSLTE